VLLLCKATAVTVAPALDVRPGCNLLHGSVTRATPRSREVAVQFAAGLQLVGFAAEGHGLKPGASAMAWIEEAAVVIAITG
jgi:molybdate transport system regulatory protein